MARIVNGQVVDDVSPKKENEKKRIYTWNDITSRNTPSNQGNQSTLHNRNTASEGATSKTSEEKPIVPSVSGYLANLLGISQYQLKIPTENPVVVIYAVYFVLLVIFALLFGYKMAVFYFK